MKLSLSFLRRSAVMASLVLALAAPSIGNAGDHHYGSRGWVAPPATYTIARVPNTYNYYWNARLAGVHSGGGGMQYPMVYQPTDTTQMGFYYQSVPRWQYRPEMLPAPPSPNWPIGRHSSGYGSSYNYGGTVTTPTATMNNGVPPGVTPVTPAPPLSPTPPPVVAPPPPAEPAVNVPEPEAAVFPNRARR